MTTTPREDDQARRRRYHLGNMIPESAVGQRDDISAGDPISRPIEALDFPFEHISAIAERESWRKEINRPTYHLHKWWAQRLGSVFRAIIIGTLSPTGTPVLDLFYSKARFPDHVVFDPFMGSGTTVGESLKLGARAIGRDINPVSHFAVKAAMSRYTSSEVQAEYHAIAADVADVLSSMYEARDEDGQPASTLYYFWVKVVDCPACSHPIDLFSSYVFAKHAYAARHPEAHAVCPKCGDLLTVQYGAPTCECHSCGYCFNPLDGPAQGAAMRCGHCLATTKIITAVQRSAAPPRHRMYAKLVLKSDGEKSYLPIDDHDLNIYAQASRTLAQRPDPYPLAALEPGYNTRQAIGYRYERWHQMFTDRQLLGLSILSDRIRQIERPDLRDLFAVLFSGTLEFNNLFTSYKGEGTGAVRHMFSHHILKPERMPLEANLWGTPKSSGAFSTLFQSRLMRALQYNGDPFEVDGGGANKKVFGLSEPLGHHIAHRYADFESGPARVYLSCGDSANTDLPDDSVDAVVTDPPFFDNVHYSELADFFHVWQQRIRGNHALDSDTTRSAKEVQSTDPQRFTGRLSEVFTECRRVLKPEGLLVFTYHHSRAEGWEAVLKALMTSGFTITAAHPVKSEMSVAAPKAQARAPIDIDIIFACRPRPAASAWTGGSDPLHQSERQAADALMRFRALGRRLACGDIRVLLMAKLILHLSGWGNPAIAVEHLQRMNGEVDQVVQRLSALDFDDAATGPIRPYEQPRLPLQLNETVDTRRQARRQRSDRRRRVWSLP